MRTLTRILISCLLFASCLFGQHAMFFSANVPVSGGGGGAITLITHASQAGTAGGSSATTAAINTTGANFLVVACNWDHSTTATAAVTDSKSNTWTALTTYGPTNASFLAIELFYAANATVGSGHTFTCTSSGSQPTLAVAAFSNVNTTPFDVENGFDSASTATLQPGSVTPAGNNELFVTGAADAGGDPSSIDSSFTITDHIANSGNNFGIGMAYKVQTTGGAENPTWTATASNKMAVDIAVFKP